MNIKRTMSGILSLIILCTAFVFTVNAESVYLESEHPYENDLTKMYIYTYPEDVDGFFVTFSKDTSLEPSGWDFTPEDFNPDWNVFDLYSHYKWGDSLSIYENYTEQACDSFEEYETSQYSYYDQDRDVFFDYDDFNVYYDRELAGKTLYIQGNMLAIELYSDESVTDYGFAVDYVGTQIPDG